MVTMVIMAVAIGAGMVMLGGDRSAYLLRGESSRLQQVLDMVATDAMLHGREWGMITTSQGYQFVRFDETSGQWLPDGDSLLAQHMLPAALSLKAQVNDRLTFPPEDSGKEPSSSSPPILLLSSGQTSSVALSLTGGDGAFVLSSDGKSGFTLYENGNGKKP